MIVHHNFFSADVPIGDPIENIRLYILDEHYRFGTDWYARTLYIAGDGLARGYLNRPELTAKQFITVRSERVYSYERPGAADTGRAHSFSGTQGFSGKTPTVFELNWTKYSTC